MMVEKPNGFETLPVSKTGISIGEKYWAKRNGSGVILTCRKHNLDEGWVVPEEMGYVYNDSECFKEKKFNYL